MSRSPSGFAKVKSFELGLAFMITEAFNMMVFVIP